MPDGGGLPKMGTATGLKSDVQWAEKWRTLGWKVTYAGLKSDVWAKMQHWSVIIGDLPLYQNVQSLPSKQSTYGDETLNQYVIILAYKRPTFAKR